MSLNDNNLIKTHNQSIHNKEQLNDSSACGCFCCLETFTPEEITEWMDEGETALCPFCNIDSVIASDDVELLSKMQDYWFDGVS